MAIAGFCLRTLCRFDDSLQATRAAIALLESEEDVGAKDDQRNDWKARAYQNLSQTQIACGELTNAVASARKAEIAARAAGSGRLSDVLARLGEALHLCARYDDAAKAFQEADRIAIATDPKSEGLKNFSAIEYCDFLLTLAELGEQAFAGQSQQALRDDVESRMAALIKKESGKDCPKLTRLGLARLLHGRAVGNTTHADATLTLLNLAVQDLDLCGELQHAPRGRLTRAAFYLRPRPPGERAPDEDLQAARVDLENVEQKLKDAPKPMPLHEIDLALTLARYHLTRAANEPAPQAAEAREEARQSIAAAAERIAEVGYQCRAPVVAELRRRLDEAECQTS